MYPRDKIYDLLGISSDGSTTGFLKPDYEKSVAEVIRDTIAFLLRFHDGIFETRCSPGWISTEFLPMLEDLGNEICLWAAENGSEAIVKLLLDTGRAEAGFQDMDGQTPLLLAARNGHKAVVKHLLATGTADDRSSGLDGWTPLWTAAINGYEAIVEGLLGYHLSQANKPNPTSKTLLKSNRILTRRLLETHRINGVSKVGRYGQTPLW
jgi:hypothetical protein